MEFCLKTKKKAVRKKREENLYFFKVGDNCNLLRNLLNRGTWKSNISKWCPRLCQQSHIRIYRHLGLNGIESCSRTNLISCQSRSLCIRLVRRLEMNSIRLLRNRRKMCYLNPRPRNTQCHKPRIVLYGYKLNNQPWSRGKIILSNSNPYFEKIPWQTNVPGTTCHNRHNRKSWFRSFGSDYQIHFEYTTQSKVFPVLISTWFFLSTYLW